MAVGHLVVARRAVGTVDGPQLLADVEPDGLQEVRGAQAQAITTALDQQGVVLNLLVATFASTTDAPFTQVCASRTPSHLTSRQLQWGT